MSFQNLFNESNLNINLIIAVDNISIDYNSTGQLEVKDGGISTAKIANDAVTTDKIFLAVTSPKIANEAITEDKIADAAVTTNKILNLAVTNDKIYDMDAGKLTGTITIPIDNVLIETDRILVGDGDENNPSISFKNDPDIGIYKVMPYHILGFVCRGYTTMTMDEYGLYIDGTLDVKNGNIIAHQTVEANRILVDDGDENNPSISFKNDTQTGIYNFGTDAIAFCANGVPTMQMDEWGLNITGNLLATGGVFADGIIFPKGALLMNHSLFPALRFDDDLTTGIFKGAALTISICSNNNEIARFNDSQVQFFRDVQWLQI